MQICECFPHTGHSPLSAAYVHCIGRRDSATCPVHIAMVLMRWQNIWCYTAQRMTRLGGSRGQISTIKAIQDACGASWRGSGRWPVPRLGMREREQCSNRRSSNNSSSSSSSRSRSFGNGSTSGSNSSHFRLLSSCPIHTIDMTTVE